MTTARHGIRRSFVREDQLDEATIWLMGRAAGTIERDPRRGTYCIRFRWVKFPTAERGREVRVYKMIGGAPINAKGLPEGQWKQRAEIVLEGIRAQLQSMRPTDWYKVISRYVADAKENAVRAHWQRFVAAKGEAAEAGDITRKRHAELAGYERRGYLDALLDRSIFDLKARDLDDWRMELQERRTKTGTPLARKTVWHVVRDVGSFLRWLERQGEIDEAPPLPEVRLGQRVQPPVPSEDALRAYLAAIPVELRGVFLIRAYNGLRMSESRALQRRDYDPRRRVVTLRHSKTGELPTLPLDYEVADWIDAHVDLSQPYLPLFTNPRTGTAWGYSSEQRVHRAACEVIGARFRMNHAGRHAFGTHAVVRTGDLALVQKAMRHRSPQTTAGYIDREQLQIGRVLRARPGIPSAHRSKEG